MRTILRSCGNVAFATTVVLAGFSAPALAEVRKARALSGEEIRKLISDQTVHIHTPLGTVMPVEIGADGSLSGKAGGVAFYLGSRTDRGRWWIAGSKLCQKWNNWFNRKSNCMTVRQKGKKIFWRDTKGETGVATIVSYRTVAEIPKKKKRKPKKLTTAAFGLGFPPTFKSHIGIPLNDPDNPPLWAKPATSAVERPSNAAAVTDSAKPQRAAQSVLSPKANNHRETNRPTFRVVGVSAPDALNIRRNPSTLAPIVGTVAPNTTGIRMSGRCSGAWCPITHEQKRGWVSRDFLAIDGRQKTERQKRKIRASTVRYKVVRVSGGDVLNIRQKPSAETPVAGTIPPDAHGIRMIGTCAGEWCPIAHGRRRGWVHRHYIDPIRLPSTRFP